MSVWDSCSYCENIDKKYIYHVNIKQWILYSRNEIYTQLADPSIGITSDFQTSLKSRAEARSCTGCFDSSYLLLYLLTLQNTSGPTA